MTLAIHLGWWAIPLALTIIIYACAHYEMDDAPSVGYESIGKGLANALIFLIATVLTLVVWILYLLLV